MNGGRNRKFDIALVRSEAVNFEASNGIVSTPDDDAYSSAGWSGAGTVPNWLGDMRGIVRDEINAVASTAALANHSQMLDSALEMRELRHRGRFREGSADHSNLVCLDRSVDRRA